MSDSGVPPVPPKQKFSISLGPSKSKSAPAKPSIKRPHAAIEDDGNGAVIQEISTFGIASKETFEAHTLAIPALPNTWRGSGRSRKRQKSALPGAAQPGAAQAIVIPEAPSYGLTVATKTTITDSSAAATNGHANGDTTDTYSLAAPPRAAKTDDELALEALTGAHDADADATRIIAPTADDEIAAFRNSYAAAPRAPTLAQYDATPVEGFGASLLRGYLKPGQTLEALREATATKAAPARPRAGGALLGVGAKAPAGMEGIELGAWGRAAQGRVRGKGKDEVPEVYVPLALRDRRTGELLTEPEAEERRKRAEETQKMVLADEGEARPREKKHGHERDGDRRREKGGNNRDRDRYGRRARDASDDESEERHKRKERRREKRIANDNSEDERDHRRPRDDDDTKSRKERDRERDRDSEADRHKHRRRSREDRHRGSDRDRERDSDRKERNREHKSSRRQHSTD